jgi:hypothetical protein
MFRTLWICLICLGVSGVGCKNKPENAPELRSDVTKEAVIGTPPGTGARLKVVRRPNGDLGVLSPDGKQVIIVQPDGYQVCEPSADALLCGPLTQMSVPCAGCFAEPCPCDNPICRPVCLQKVPRSTGSGSASPGTP